MIYVGSSLGARQGDIRHRRRHGHGPGARRGAAEKVRGVPQGLSVLHYLYFGLLLLSMQEHCVQGSH